MLVDGHGVPLSLVVSGANRHDSVMLDTLLSLRVTPSEMGVDGKIVENLCLDAGYVGKAEVVEKHGMVAHVRPRGGESEARPHGFKPRRWIVEVAHPWFNRFRKIHTRYEKTDVAYKGLLFFAAALITTNKVMKIYPVMY